MSKLQCYRLGCQQTYDPDENSETSCTFHPGAPFFHDAYKGWSCCKKKCVDFTEFLNIKGCTKGFHSNEKPPEPEKRVETVDIPEVVEVRPPVYAMKRPGIDSPMEELVPTVTESLRKITYSVPASNVVNSEVEEVKVGGSCHHNGCKTIYEGPSSNDSPCVHHPGVPIFHEGYKYWSCCKKKTTEFEVFQNQKGCTTGTHLWIKPDDESTGNSGNKTIKCRVDWIQTGANIAVVLYAKKCDPEKSIVRLNGVKLHVEIFFPEETGYYKNTWILSGIVDPQKSSVTMTPNKIEVTMKKAEPVYWTALEITPEKLKAIQTLSQDACKTTGVDPVNLDDL